MPMPMISAVVVYRSTWRRLSDLLERVRERIRIAKPDVAAETDTESHDLAYDAFISYRRLDGLDLAKWLRNRLQSYRLPRTLRRHLAPGARGPQGGPLRVFRDEDYEGADEDFWQKFVIPNLQQSRHLIVISTHGAFAPRSDGQPNWLTREIDVFLELRRADPRRRIILVLGPGAPEDRFPGRLDDPAVGDGIERPRWNWADLRSFSLHRARSWRTRFGLDDQFAKIVAPLYDVPSELIPMLRREGVRKLVMALVAALLTVTAVAAAIGVLGVVAYQQKNIAQDRLQEALARQLAAQADLVRIEQPKRLSLSTSLAMEAVRRWQTLESVHALQASLALLPRPLAHLQHESPVLSLAISRDGRQVATGSRDGTVKIQPVTFAAEAMTFQHDGPVTNLAFSPDTKLLASASDDKTARLYELASGRELYRWEHEKPVHAVQFSPDARYLGTVSGSPSGDNARLMRVWDISTGRELPSQKGPQLPAAAEHPSQRGCG